jgi:mono/diheme cytochrome c family protein
MISRCFAALLVAIVLCGAAFAQSAPKPADIYKQKCAICHGPDGKSQTVMAKNLGAPDLTSEKVQSVSDAEIKDVLENGKGKMPPPKLDPKSIDVMLKYVRSLKGK